mmetsp:Transcript_15837/g.26744  ORF Transcript_15837/g.26744 Transcript_15837/m.26744 type:complete len:235 (-) Transcript_15837:422-1126(-)
MLLPRMEGRENEHLPSCGNCPRDPGVDTVYGLEPWTGVLKRFDSENTVSGLPIEPGVLIVDSCCVKEVVPVGGRGGQDPFDPAFGAHCSPEHLPYAIPPASYCDFVGDPPGRPAIGADNRPEQPGVCGPIQLEGLSRVKLPGDTLVRTVRVGLFRADGNLWARSRPRLAGEHGSPVTMNSVSGSGTFRASRFGPGELRRSYVALSSADTKGIPPERVEARIEPSPTRTARSLRG